MIANFRPIAVAAARAAADKKARDIRVLDLRAESDLADYMVIAGAESSAQMRAIQDHVEAALEEKGLRLFRREGRGKDRWMALDYGGLVVHVLLEEARVFYRLERLWGKARRVRWEKARRPKQTAARSGHVLR